MDELPSILRGVDVLALLEIEVDEDADLEERKRSLRRLFLKKAKKLHPDKQRKDDPEGERNELEFVRIKAAFDFLQAKNNFALLYNKALSELRAKRRRLERSRGIASRQASYLDSLLKREQEASERRAGEAQAAPAREAPEEAYYDELFASFQRAEREVDPSLGQLVVAAKTLAIANGSELNCLLLSSHFPALFDNYGLVRVELLDVLDDSVDRNIKVGRIVFRSREHAMRALLHYRNNRAKFRCDLYALALGRAEAPDAQLDASQAFARYEESVLRRFRALAAAMVKN